MTLTAVGAELLMKKSEMEQVEIMERVCLSLWTDADNVHKNDGISFRSHFDSSSDGMLQQLMIDSDSVSGKTSENTPNVPKSAPGRLDFAFSFEPKHLEEGAVEAVNDAYDLNPFRATLDDTFNRNGEEMVKKLVDTSFEWPETKAPQVPNSAPAQVFDCQTAFMFPPPNNYSIPEVYCEDKNALLKGHMHQLPNRSPSYFAPPMLPDNRGFVSPKAATSAINLNIPGVPRRGDVQFSRRNRQSLPFPAFQSSLSVKPGQRILPPLQNASFPEPRRPRMSPSFVCTKREPIIPLNKVRPVLDEGLLMRFDAQMCFSKKGVSRIGGKSDNGTSHQATLVGCNYCKAIGREWQNHNKESCPALAGLRPCRLCSASGINNHTITHCPMKGKVLLKKKAHHSID